MSTLLPNADGALFSEDGRYRYKLWRYLGGNAGTYLWIMLNPSVANAEKDDPTMRRVLGYSSRWNATRVVVCNLFALVSTKPIALVQRSPAVGDGPRRHCYARDAVGDGNDDVLLEEALQARKIVCGWGTGGDLQHPDTGEKRSRDVLTLLDHHEVWCLGIGKSGEPNHPLYQPGDAVLRRLEHERAVHALAGGR